MNQAISERALAPEGKLYGLHHLKICSIREFPRTSSAVALSRPRQISRLSADCRSRLQSRGQSLAHTHGLIILGIVNTNTSALPSLAAFVYALVYLSLRGQNRGKTASFALGSIALGPQSKSLVIAMCAWATIAIRKYAGSQKTRLEHALAAGTFYRRGRQEVLDHFWPPCRSLARRRCRQCSVPAAALSRESWICSTCHRQ